MFESPLVRPEHTIKAFESFPADRYEELDLTGLVAYAVQRLHSLQLPTTFENIVVTLFRLFPAKFCLVGFSDYPDAARVGRSLLQLGPKYRNWARGSVQKGFVLTDSGIAKANEVSQILAGGKHVQRKSRSRPLPRTMDLSKDMESIENSKLYRQWKSNNSRLSDLMQLLEMLGAYAYTPKRVLRQRLSMLENTASQLDRRDIVEFLGSVRKDFAEQLRD